MRGPTDQSTNPPAPNPSAPPRATAARAPAADPYVYHLTLAAQSLLAEHERATGAVLHRPAVPAAEVAASEAREAKRRRRKVLRRRARCRGRRLGTISYRWSGDENRPLLRLSGKWLARNGFPIGQEFEVVVEEGRLVLEAV
jgi:hypothetical protein